MLTLQVNLLQVFPFEAFQDELSKYLQNNRDIVLKFAESHGIDFPPPDDVVGDEQTQETGEAVGVVVSPGISAAKVASEANSADVGLGIKTEESTGDTGLSLSLALGLGQLIQQSLQKEEASQPPPEVSGSKGLASLIAEKIGESANGISTPRPPSK